MGKKGSWFSAIKRVFLPNSKEKLVNGAERKNEKEKKKKGRDVHSFIPLFREPSSIEKILGDAEREQQNKIFLRPPTPSETPKVPTPVPPRASSPRVTSPRAAPSPRAAASPRAATSPRAAASPRAGSSRAFHQHKEVGHRPEPTLRNRHIAAIRIQAAYRGYMARRSFRALRGLVRLQGVVRGQNVKRQTVHAMKCMQLLVRVQSQIQSRRIQMLENQAVQRQSQYKNEKDLESNIGKWALSQPSDGGNEDWDDSQLTKEEIEARLQRKVDAVIKRERAMAYAYSHQLWKTTPKSAQASVMDLRSGGFPWWWNWLERQLPPANPPESQATKSVLMTPTRPTPDLRPSPRPQASNYKQQSFGFDHLESLTPKSSKSAAAPARAKSPLNRVQQANGSSAPRYAKPRASAADSSTFDAPLRDDDSLTSCPPFSVPNYMTPTVSAKAKARATSNPKERYPATPSTTESKRRLSFPLGQGAGTFKWNKGTLFSSKDSTSQRGVIERHQSMQSTGNLSVDSTVSLPATAGRKPFNRFV